jgi:DNA-directed RNA polymerase specialized sigma24 family protein
MRSGTHQHLTAFNRQVLEWQEAAYTLAYYLTGSQEQAEEIVQAAVLQAYLKNGGAEGTRAALLKAVVASACKQARFPTQANGSDLLSRTLSGLSHERRCAVLLVDVLGLTYDEAARVLSSTPARVSEWLAQGRVAAMSYA